MPSQFSRTTRSLAKDTSHIAMVVWVCAGLLLAGWFGWFFFGRVTVYELSRSARLEVQQSAYPVVGTVAGKIISTRLALGQQVHAGEVLVQLDARSATLRLQEEQVRLQAFTPRIASLIREIFALEQVGTSDHQAALAASQAAGFRTREAGAAADFASENKRRLNEESAVGSVAQIEALRADAEASKSSATREALAADALRLDADGKTRSNQYRVVLEGLRRSVAALESERTTTEAVIARLQQEIEKHLLRSTADGTIGDVAPLRAGAYVTEGQLLATVVPRGALIIVASFAPAAVLGRIHPGQASRMRLDGFPWAQFGSIEARVTRVASEIRDNLVRVEFALAPSSVPKIILQHGLPGAVEVSIDQVSPAVLVLRAAGQLSTQPDQQGLPPVRPTAS